MNQQNNNELKPVPAAIAEEMVQAYSHDFLGTSSAYTKAVWFPAAEIKKIAQILEDGLHDGLRIYFAQYTTNALEGAPESYDGRNTVLLVPTLAAVGGKTDSEEHKDDLTEIYNRGQICPDKCDGTEL